MSKVEQVDFAPCPTCHQYSHSIGEDKVAVAFRFFQGMIAHPVRGHPMGDAFDEQTRDAAQVLVAAYENASALGHAEGYAQCQGDAVTWLRAQAAFPRLGAMSLAFAIEQSAQGDER